jgi:hypothetical protein
LSNIILVGQGVNCKKLQYIVFNDTTFNTEIVLKMINGQYW